MSSEENEEEVETPDIDLSKRFHVTSNGTVLSTADTQEEARQHIEDYKVARGEALAEVQHYVTHPNPIVIDRGTKHPPKPGVKPPPPHRPPPGPEFHPPVRQSPATPPVPATPPPIPVSTETTRTSEQSEPPK
jgi:hypothetical protein